MENFSAENPIDKINFLIKMLVDFSNENEFDFAIYKEFAKESSITFNRYFTQINNELDKEKIISDLKTDFHFSIDDIVTNMMTTKNRVDNFETEVTYYIAQPTTDNRVRGYESNYKQLIELFLNSVEFGVKPKTKAVPENPHPTIFTGIDNKNFTLFETFTKYHVLDKYVDFSFIFQQMKFNGYILDIKHLKFMKWLHENNYLTEKEYFDFQIEKGFRALNKCAFGTRVNLYLKLQGIIILSSSDLSE